MSKSCCVCAAIVLCLALASSSPLWADDCPSGTAVVTVTLDQNDKEVDVDPASVTIYLDKAPKTVCWQVENLRKSQQLRIRHKPSAEKPNLLASREVKAVKHVTSSTPTETGSWDYEVVVLNLAGTYQFKKDPIVIIKGGGG